MMKKIVNWILSALQHLNQLSGPGKMHEQPILLGTVSVEMFTNRIYASIPVWGVAGEPHVKEVFPDMPVGPLCVSEVFRW